jgi:hypothetical protein
MNGNVPSIISERMAPAMSPKVKTVFFMGLKLLQANLKRTGVKVTHRALYSRHTFE